MTNEEANKELEWVKERGFVADVGIIGTDRIVESIQMAIEAIKKQEQYRWHDLRKNTDDLPEIEYATVEVWTSNKIVDICIWNKEYGFRPWYAVDEVYIPDDMYNPLTDIIKWREIELDEDEE